MTEPVWADADVVYRIHEMQIAEHGGLAGVRDPGLVESALARPKQQLTYGEPDLAALAAAYAAGLCRTQGFVEGNKRTAFVTGEVFLRANGLRTQATQAEVVAAVESLADHSISEAAYANWLRAHTAPL